MEILEDRYYHVHHKGNAPDELLVVAIGPSDTDDEQLAAFTLGKGEEIPLAYLNFVAGPFVDPIPVGSGNPSEADRRRAKLITDDGRGMIFCGPVPGCSAKIRLPLHLEAHRAEERKRILAIGQALIDGYRQDLAITICAAFLRDIETASASTAAAERPPHTVRESTPTTIPGNRIEQEFREAHTGTANAFTLPVMHWNPEIDEPTEPGFYWAQSSIVTARDKTPRVVEVAKDPNLPGLAVFIPGYEESTPLNRFLFLSDRLPTPPVVH